VTGPYSRLEWVSGQAYRLGDDVVALEAIVPRSTVTANGASGHGRNGAAPLPVRDDVLDLQREIEREVLRLRYRAAVLLGRKVPPIPLSRRYYYPCPYCEANSLWVIPDGWYIDCRNPECSDPEGRRREWHQWADLEHLRDMVAALVAEALDNPQAQQPAQEQTA
jgi:hypothetical protein